jgi:hypothetical protein
MEMQGFKYHMKLPLKEFQLFALMHNDTILQCPLEIISRLLSLYF